MRLCYSLQMIIEKAKEYEKTKSITTATEVCKMIIKWADGIAVDNENTDENYVESDKLYRVGYIDGVRHGWYKLRWEINDLLDDDGLLENIKDRVRAELENMYDIKFERGILTYRTKKDTE